MADTFQIGDKEITLRSSLSSLTEQIPGSSLLSDADIIQSNTPLIKASPVEDESSSTKPKRTAPLVPSPLSLLEESLGRPYSEEDTIESEERDIEEPEQPTTNDVIAVESPDKFVELLKQSKLEPTVERRIKINSWILIGMNGHWAVQPARRRRGRDMNDAPPLSPAIDDAYDPETSFTWHLPGFITIRWYRQSSWSVTTRELSPADEIKWDLVSIGKRLQSMDKVMTVARQALVYHLHSTIHKISVLYQSVRSAYEVPIEQQAERLDDAKDKDLGKLIRGELCMRVAAVLFDGFNDWSLLTKYHIWDWILEAAMDRTSTAQLEALALLSTVRQIEQATPASDQNVKFRNFIVSALNQRLLYQWMLALINNTEQAEEWFDEISLVRQVPQLLTAAFAPLSALPFQLSSRER